MTTINGIEIRNESVTISSGGTVSTAIDLNGLTMVGLIMPATFTGTTITFQISDDNATFYALNNTSNSALSMTVSAGKAYAFSPGDFIVGRYLKLVSGSTEGADRVIKIISRGLA